MKSFFDTIAKMWTTVCNGFRSLVRSGRPRSNGTESSTRGERKEGRSANAGANATDTQTPIGSGEIDASDEEEKDLSASNEGRAEEELLVREESYTSATNESDDQVKAEGEETAPQPPQGTSGTVAIDENDTMPADDCESQEDSAEGTVQEPPVPGDGSAQSGNSSASTPQTKIRQPKRVTRRRNATAGVRSSAGTKSKRYQPKVVCQKILQPATWGLKLDLSKCRSVSWVRQGERTLSLSGNEVLLDDYREDIVVGFEDGKTRRVRLFNGKWPLVFRMQQQWEGAGEKAKWIGKGFCMAVVPLDWTRKGHAPVAREDCVDKGFIAHYFRPGTVGQGPDADGFAECDVDFIKKFVLQGQVLEDSLSHESSLFVGPSPGFVDDSGVDLAKLWSYDSSEWESCVFKPGMTSLDENLDGRWGEYALSLADSEGKKLEGVHPTDIRYCSELNQVLVDGRPYVSEECWVPEMDGHRVARLRFINQDGDGMVATPVGSSRGTLSHESGTIEIPADPEADETAWELCSPDGNSVRVGVRLPRLWWRMVVTGQEVGPWADRLQEVPLGEFRDLAESGARIELKVPPAVKAVSLGVDDVMNQEHRVAKGFPLSAISRYPQPNTDTQDSWNVRIRPIGFEKDVVLFRVLRDQPLAQPEPLISVVEEPHGEGRGRIMEVEPRETDRLPTAWVIGTKGWRYGRGYSRSELRASGVSEHQVRSRNGRVDRRRRHAHSRNVIVLKGGQDASR